MPVSPVCKNKALTLTNNKLTLLIQAFLLVVLILQKTYLTTLQIKEKWFKIKINMDLLQEIIHGMVCPLLTCKTTKLKYLVL